MSELKKSGDWEANAPFIVMDPDGWDRSSFKASWEEPITKEEFKKRAKLSTVKTKQGFTCADVSAHLGTKIVGPDWVTDLNDPDTKAAVAYGENITESYYYSRDIDSLAKCIGVWRRGKGFLTPTSIDNSLSANDMLGKLMLVVSEVSEAAEAVRSADIENFAEELADTVIRIMDITDACGISLAKSIAYKMEKNEGRPHLHGRKTTL